eukprot:385488-Pleurochrysis_carterae.AAC.1
MLLLPFWLFATAACGVAAATLGRLLKRIRVPLLVVAESGRWGCGAGWFFGATVRFRGACSPLRAAISSAAARSLVALPPSSCDYAKHRLSEAFTQMILDFLLASYEASLLLSSRVPTLFLVLSHRFCEVLLFAAKLKTGEYSIVLFHVLPQVHRTQSRKGAYVAENKLDGERVLLHFARNGGGGGGGGGDGGGGGGGGGG